MPMTSPDAEVVLGRVIKPAKHSCSVEGYLIQYEDGYRSWSPKEVFDKAYRPADNFLDRLVIERDELQRRLLDLKTSLMTDGFHEKVGDKQFYWMQEQRNAMEIYVEVLNKRITHAINNK